MLSLNCGEIVNATGGRLICGDTKLKIPDITTDSRKINQGELFVPIVGEKFDGHDFISKAFESGASAVLTHKDAEPVPGKVIIRVEDTLKALGDLASYYRRKFNIPFIGVTGSVGKTTTKDMIADVLGQKFNVLKTAGNFNNEIGLPLTMFKLDGFHQAAVIEMGMSGFGEIRRLTSIVRPSVAVITNIGLSHIEKLGSRQNILKAKMEILDGLEDGGLVVLNGDDNLLFGMKDLLKFRTVFYGIGEGLDYQAYNIKSAGEHGTFFEIAVGNREYKVHIPAPGVHNVYNALASIAVGLELNVPFEKILEGVKQFNTGNMRMNIISHNDYKIINDAYNASPQSMEAALDVLRDMGSNRRKIAVLGDMLEMGEWAPKAHMDVGKSAASKGIDYIITLGENGKFIAEGAADAGFLGENIIFI